MNYSKKILTFAIVLLFLGTSVIPLTVSTYFSADPPVNIALDGILGDNGWFISCVTIMFMINGGEVDYIMYNLDGGEWTVYTEAFVVCKDGHHMISWYYADNEGNQSEIECMDFKIDQIKPTIGLTIERIGFWKYMAKADVSDETSGVNRVELYFDNKLIKILTEEPYEYVFSAISIAHLCEAIVFDNAGNYEISFIPPPGWITETHVFGIIRNPKFTEDTVSFFAILVLCRMENSFIFCPFFRQLTFYTVYETYSGYISDHFICAVFPFGPW